MRLHAYQDENRSGHLDIVGRGDHPWTIDVVAVTLAAMLVMGFAAALAADLIW
jgi:hypothetical protein